MIYTNAPPAVAPHGALKTLFGTNPICFGTPTGSKVPFILDTSISMINRGKIRVAAATLILPLLIIEIEVSKIKGTLEPVGVPKQIGLVPNKVFKAP